MQRDVHPAGHLVERLALHQSGHPRRQLDHLDPAAHLAAGLVEMLAVLARHQPGEPVELALEQRLEDEHAASAPGHRLVLPRLERLGRHPHGLVDLGWPGQGHAAEHLAGRGVQHVQPVAGLRVDRPTADEAADLGRGLLGRHQIVSSMGVSATHGPRSWPRGARGRYTPLGGSGRTELDRPRLVALRQAPAPAGVIGEIEQTIEVALQRRGPEPHPLQPRAGPPVVERHPHREVGEQRLCAPQSPALALSAEADQDRMEQPSIDRWGDHARGTAPEMAGRMLDQAPNGGGPATGHEW